MKMVTLQNDDSVHDHEAKIKISYKYLLQTLQMVACVYSSIMATSIKVGSTFIQGPL